MPKFPQVQTSKKIPQFIAELRARQVPKKVDHTWIAAAGFKSSNDRAFRPMLAFLGTIDSSGLPIQEKYSLLRAPDPAWRVNLGDLIKRAYTEIFSDYPNANELSRPQLIDLFRASDNDASEVAAGIMVSTFQELCRLAQFAESPDIPVPVPVATPEFTMNDLAPSPPRPAAAPPSSVPLTVNLSLELPADQTAEIYDQIFESMSKHLGKLISGGSD